MWINNPTLEETHLAIEEGAIHCTTNPAFVSRILKVEKPYVEALIDEVLDEYLESGKKHFDDDEAAIRVCEKATKPIMDLFMPMYEASGGEVGHVTMQGDPRLDMDKDYTVEVMLRYAKLSPNLMAKIPVVKGGIEAIEECVKYNIPICATEIFAISQAITLCEKYEAACSKYNNRPMLFVTHISGIFDEYLGKVAKRKGIEISEEALNLAGVSVARKQFKVLAERGYNAVMLGGGARGLHHFTELVGGPHITINWSTAHELIEKDYDIAETINKAPDEKVIAELIEKFEDFRLAYDEEGLTVDQYAEFGPVQLFRNAFLTGWYTLLAAITARRNARAI
ncbi:MAG: transaldolase family protein [Christensenellales bacterium]|jgi:transaldolase